MKRGSESEKGRQKTEEIGHKMWKTFDAHHRSLSLVLQIRQKRRNLRAERNGKRKNVRKKECNRQRGIKRGVQSTCPTPTQSMAVKRVNDRFARKPLYGTVYVIE